MSPRAKLQETAAKAICAHQMCLPVDNGAIAIFWDDWMPLAQTVFQAIEAEGFVIMPRQGDRKPIEF